ncbi:MAG TPA: TlpA disulfide reductase family protein [Vicinamibacterales bacterium]|nr:TlpA disulfide reductase family protein [Vicinamibacterales bacterium]
MPINGCARWVGAAIVASALAVCGADTGIAAADDKALSLQMPSAEGRSLRLSDLKGKVVLVKFWASWCPQCQEAYPKLAELQRELRPRGVEIVAISVDEQRKNATAFLATHPSDLLVTFDPRGRVLEAFGASAIPASFVLDRSGTVRYRHSGYTAESLAAYRREIETLLSLQD